MTFPRLVLGVSAVLYAALGVGFVAFPYTLAAAVDIALTSVSADNDFRAVYGGVPGGLAIFLFMGLRRREWEVPALWVVALTLGGLAASRFVSWALAGWPGPIVLALHAAEVSGLALSLFAIRLSVRDTRS